MGVMECTGTSNIDVSGSTLVPRSKVGPALCSTSQSSWKNSNLCLMLAA